jgi:hypothetical protein
VVPEEGFEPSRDYSQRILSPSCLPFHHPGFLKRTHLLENLSILFFLEITIGVIQTHLFLTQTFVDQHLLYQNLAHVFLQNLHLPLYISKTEQDFTNHQKFQKYIDNQQIILPKIDSKEDFRNQVLSYYKDYTQPTILFLGNVGQFSLALQESFLKLLEEPPANLFIFLLSPGEFKLLPTITSRSQIHYLNTDYIYQILDPEIKLKIEKKLPKPSDYIVQIFQNQTPEIKDINNLEREELEMWLWQIQESLEALYNQNPKTFLAEKIAQVLKARNLNLNNVQKKLVLAQLTL